MKALPAWPRRQPLRQTSSLVSLALPWQKSAEVHGAGLAGKEMQTGRDMSACLRSFYGSVGLEWLTNIHAPPGRQAWGSEVQGNEVSCRAGNSAWAFGILMPGQPFLSTQGLLP